MVGRKKLVRVKISPGNELKPPFDDFFLFSLDPFRHHLRRERALFSLPNMRSPIVTGLNLVLIISEIAFNRPGLVILQRL